MNTHRFHIIFPADLWDRIQALAKRNRRTVTQEILIAIERHIASEEVTDHDHPQTQALPRIG